MLFLLPAGLFSLHSVTCAFELTCYSFGEPPDRFYHKVFPISVLKQKKTTPHQLKGFVLKPRSTPRLRGGHQEPSVTTYFYPADRHACRQTGLSPFIRPFLRDKMRPASWTPCFFVFSLVSLCGLCRYILNSTKKFCPVR